jgi:uncharacterized protein
MPIQPTYPGVYVIEEPSGVRTITGVSTSIATFIGRTKMGPMLEPTRCLNYTEFERTFSADSSMSELARSVRLFFLNGGSQCYVVRIAKDAKEAKDLTDPNKSHTILNNETGTLVLNALAKSAGLVGNTIRLAITYNNSQPEALFNLEVFRWEKNSASISVKKDSELWASLSMDPSHPRYAVTYINQNSKLIDLEDKSTAPALSVKGYSQSGPIPKGILAGITTNKKFRISVNRSAFIDVNLGIMDITDLEVTGLAVSPIETAINLALADASISESVKVTTPAFIVGTNIRLKIESLSGGDVFIEPAAIVADDITRKLMLGTAQGGLEFSRYSENRPAANGIVFNTAKFLDFAVLTQDNFDTIKLTPTSFSSPEIFLGTLLQTTTPPPASTHKMYENAIVVSVPDRNDGVREKWGLIANAINGQKITDPSFPWSSEVWGSRLVILSTNGADNSVGSFSTFKGLVSADIGSDFTASKRYYSLGGGTEEPPKIADYKAAYDKIDKEVDIFNLMILPNDSGHLPADTRSLWGEASVFCQKKRAFLLMDAPSSWKTKNDAINKSNGVENLRISLVKDHSAIFYPRLTLQDNVQVGATGAIAGLMARTDSNRGVWKAPAGTEADIRGILGLEYRFSDEENGVLNPHAINTIRIFPSGIVNWGARTMAGDDDEGSEWKYIPVRRTALFIEESLYRGLKWVVFEPNDEPLWSQIRLNVGAFMHNLFRQGAFQGQKRDDAYFVKCDKETTTQNDINLGIVNVWVGFAPLKPAEFVILHLQQMTGQIQV